MLSQDKKTLNREQKDAVRYGRGPLLVIAGAGTGKTTVIVERIRYLITKRNIKPAEILALTFTDKAAREMEERVDQVLPYGYVDMWISTFHAFCDRILRDESIHIGLDPGYKLMGQAEAIQFLIKNLFKLDLDYFRPLGNPTKFIHGLIGHFSRLKDEDVSPSEYLRWAQAQNSKIKTQNSTEKKQEAEKYLELAKAYQKYEEFKIKEGLMDFGDLITNVLRLFRNRKNVLTQYQKKFKYILVDEFQDTNIAQNELVMLLAGQKANLTVVADDDQSIYKWRGAAVSNVLQLRKNYPQMKVITLTCNYRSTQKILNHAYRLIQYNNPDRLEVKEKINKHLEAIRQEKGNPVELIFTNRVEEEADRVAETIKSLKLKNESYSWQDFAILVRANNHAEPFIRALVRLGIPYQFLGPGQLFRCEEVKDLIAYLKLLYNFEDNVAAYRLLSMAVFNLSARDLAAIVNFSRKMNLSLFEACEKIEEILVSAETKDKIRNFVGMVYRHLKLVSKKTAGQIAYYFLEDSGLLKRLSDYKTVEEENKAQNIAKFFDRLKTYESDHEDASIQAVVDWINLSLELGESPLANNFDWSQEDRVNLLTVHSSKGLEFPVVFLVNLVSARFPTYKRQEQIPLPEELIKETLPEGDYHLQEERRLFYVGMTRAKDYLFLAAAKYYGEGKREKKVSPFVFESLGEDVAQKIISQRTPIEDLRQLSILDFAPQSELKQQLDSRSGRQEITYLSFSQIETFDTCPLQYRYRYIQRIPIPSSGAQSFGNSIHNTLRKFYQKIKEGQKPSPKKLISLLDKNWSSVGYLSKAHERRMKNHGKRLLADFYQKGFNPQDKIKDLERLFKIKLVSDFSVGGKIDRIDEVTGGIEIYDYKTGKVWDQQKVDASLQMTLYTLAVVSHQSSLFANIEPENITLSFYFLETGEKKTTRRNRESLQKARKEILAKRKEIGSSDFPPTPGLWCDFCDFKLICEAWS
ncbi:MAG TPA: ATP-dependent DNA helicase [Candidatus Bathyarchaeia archaeon]|nr:ATP-dependent DNA helicase [Candidatus Bathyarchaeia archaeon]